MSSLAEDQDVDRFNKALAAVGAGPGDIGGKGTSFRTRYGRLEVVRNADGIGGYEAWLEQAREQRFESLTIHPNGVRVADRRQAPSA